ncbi:hypothetical protein ECG_03303 [Echinococcus granulosus]|nr:hypothetical protein ECG_03303 [Echinococcus granulosus]
MLSYAHAPYSSHASLHHHLPLLSTISLPHLHSTPTYFSTSVVPPPNSPRLVSSRLVSSRLVTTATAEGGEMATDNVAPLPLRQRVGRTSTQPLSHGEVSLMRCTHTTPAPTPPLASVASRLHHHTSPHTTTSFMLSYAHAPYSSHASLHHHLPLLSTISLPHLHSTPTYFSTSVVPPPNSPRLVSSRLVSSRLVTTATAEGGEMATDNVAPLPLRQRVGRTSTQPLSHGEVSLMRCTHTTPAPTPPLASVASRLHHHTSPHTTTSFMLSYAHAPYSSHASLHHHLPLLSTISLPHLHSTPTYFSTSVVPPPNSPPLASSRLVSSRLVTTATAEGGEMATDNVAPLPLRQRVGRTSTQPLSHGEVSLMRCTHTTPAPTPPLASVASRLHHHTSPHTTTSFMLSYAHAPYSSHASLHHHLPLLSTISLPHLHSTPTYFSTSVVPPPNSPPLASSRLVSSRLVTTATAEGGEMATDNVAPLPLRQRVGRTSTQPLSHGEVSLMRCTHTTPAPTPPLASVASRLHHHTSPHTTTSFMLSYAHAPYSSHASLHHHLPLLSTISLPHLHSTPTYFSTSVVPPPNSPPLASSRLVSSRLVTTATAEGGEMATDNVAPLPLRQRVGRTSTQPLSHGEVSLMRCTHTTPAPTPPLASVASRLHHHTSPHTTTSFMLSYAHAPYSSHASLHHHLPLLSTISLPHLHSTPTYFSTSVVPPPNSPPLASSRLVSSRLVTTATAEGGEMATDNVAPLPLRAASRQDIDATT